jgi:hypothetical protein
VAVSKNKALLTSQFDVSLRKIAIKYYIWSMAVSGAETWTFRAVDRKCLESFEIW